ncbi:MAG: PIN domain-containing protein [Nanoarchaeota archaeon]
MTDYIIDTSAWIEYLEGSQKGEAVNKFLKNEQIFIIPIIISEVVSKAKRLNRNIDLAYSSLIKNSKVFEITPRIAKEAGLLHAETRLKIPSFALADATIICSARAFKAKILTTDNHFKSFKEAIII